MPTKSQTRIPWLTLKPSRRKTIELGWKRTWCLLRQLSSLLRLSCVCSWSSLTPTSPSILTAMSTKLSSFTLYSSRTRPLITTCRGETSPCLCLKLPFSFIRTTRVLLTLRVRILRTIMTKTTIPTQLITGLRSTRIRLIVSNPVRTRRPSSRPNQLLSRRCSTSPDTVERKLTPQPSRPRLFTITKPSP